MLTTFDIRLGAIQDHNAQDSNIERYKQELKTLAQDIGTAIVREDDFSLLYTYKRVKQELSFITSSGTVETV